MEFENLLKLVRAVSDSELTGFKYEENGVKINLSKKKEKVKVIHGETSFTAVPQTTVQTLEAIGEVQKPLEEKKEAEGKVVKSPLVGTFYAAPSEDASPFAAVGDTVKKGQTLAIVEAMKLMNEIDSDYDGIITEILVENGQAVEYGQPLFRIS